MSAKHTPGPWLQWADTNIIIRLHSGAPRSEDLRICEVSTNTRHDEGAANARLIAAAPELLEALQKLIMCWQSVCNGHGWDPEHVIEATEARAAIAKATGSAS